MEYPVKEKIKLKADSKTMTLIELGASIGKSDRWIHGIKSINDLTLEMITRISNTLEFDFLSDYKSWLMDNDQPVFSHWQDAPLEYKKKGQEITINFGVRGARTTLAVHMDEILNAIQKQVDIYGLEIV